MNLDTQWKIALEIPYRSLSSYCRSSSTARSICQAPRFWQVKTIHDFPKFISNRAQFEAIPERTDRLRYLNVYNRVNEADIKEIRNEIDDLEQLNARGRRRFLLAVKVMEEKLRDYIELGEYIHLQRQDRFRRYDAEGNEIGRLPRIHNWSKYGETKVPVFIGDDGEVVYRYVDQNGQTVELDLSGFMDADEVADANYQVPIADILLYQGDDLSLQDLMYILEQVNPDFYPEPVLPDDLIDLRNDPEFYFSEVYFVYQSPDGSLDLAKSVGYDLPEEVFDMFRRRDIHSQVDLIDLYGSRMGNRDQIDTTTAILRIPQDENQYNEQKPYYYHASMLPELLRRDEN